jgi:ABC-type molybdate transport system substrate-binding protein
VRQALKLAIAVLIVVLSVGGYAGYLYYTGLQTPLQNPTELRVFVASSMNTIVTDNKEPFQKGNNVNLLFNAGGSDALYTDNCRITG